MKQVKVLAYSLLLSLASCGLGTGSRTQEALLDVDGDVTAVIYFHGKQRCITCNAIEDRIREVVTSMDSTQVVMRVVDISARENRAIADRYEVTWSALVLERNGKTENLTELGFGYAKSEPEVFKAKLKEAILQLSE